MKGNRFYVEDTGSRGAVTGRPRYRVICLDCGRLIQMGTTEPAEDMARHADLCVGTEPTAPEGG